jgi:hypothetical protein
MSSIFGSPFFLHYNSNVNNNPAASGKRPYGAVLGIPVPVLLSGKAVKKIIIIKNFQYKWCCPCGNVERDEIVENG